MKTRLVFILLLGFLFSSSQAFSQQSNMWVTGYYPVWSLGTTNGGNPNAMYPHETNWNGVTHVVHFGVGPDQTAPYWHPDATNNFGGPSNDSLNMFYAYDWRGNMNYSIVDSLRKYIHIAGGKLLLSCGGIWGAQATAMNYITSDSARTQVFVNTVVAFASRHGYDGIEIDYEPPQSQTAMSLLTRIMKRRMTVVLGSSAPLVMTCANLAESNYNVALKDSVAQYLFMMYDMHNPYNGIGSAGGPYDVTGFNAPVHLPDAVQYPIVGTASLNFDGSRPAAPSQSWGPNKFATMGFPRSKIGVGIPFYGYAFDTKNAPNQSASGIYAHYLNYIDALQFKNSGGGAYHYDATAKVPWLGGTATQSIGWVITSGHQTYVTYDDTNSVKEKVQWAKDNGFGGMMIYELWTGWVASAPAGQKDPLLRALVNSVNNAPVLTPTGTFSATPGTLPAGGGSVTLTWTSSNALTASIDQGVGSVALNGSRSVPVTATTTFTITLTNANGSRTYTAPVTVTVPPPTGTFSASPDTLSAGGGNVTLSWTSTNAQSATINQGVGTVALSGSRVITVGTTTTYTLTLTNGGGSRQYTARVGVGLPGGQGEQDITSEGTPAALITTPTGTGNTSLEVIRDGNVPPQGSSNPLQQYDTYNGTTRSFDWVGYQFPTTRRFSHLLLQEGIHFANGGWLTTPRVQVLTGGVWTDVLGLQVSPSYGGGNGVNYESFDLTFTQTTGNGVRIAGVPGGSATFFSVGELRVYEAPVATPAGLVAAYGFNEGSGATVADLSGNGLSGSVSGATWTTQGKYGNALSFNGTSSYVDLGTPAQLQITGSMTWSAWVKAAANPADDGGIVAKATATAGSQLRSSPDTGPQTFGVTVSANASSITERYSVTTRALNTWYHVAGVYNATTQSLDIYVNGVLDNGVLVGSIPASQYLPAVNTLIGRRSAGYYFNGVIDEVRLYSRALSQVEIQADMNTPLGTASLPPAPACLAPANGATGQTTSLTFRWNRVSTATGYRLQVSPDSLFSSIFLDDAQLTDTVRSVTSLAPSTKYYWRVSSRSAAGEGSYSSIWRFTTLTAAPASPVLVSPADNASGQSLTTTLRWRTAASATSYHVQLASDSLFAAPILNDSSLTDTLRTTSTLATQTRYFWRVRARNTTGYSAYTTRRSFTTLNSLPTAPVLQSPADNATGQPLTASLRWRVSSGATLYHLQMGSDSLFSSFIINDSTLVDTTRVTGTLSFQSRYFWRVRAKNSIGYGPYSTRRSFTTTGSTPDAPALLFPSNSANNQSITPLLRWRRALTSSSYLVQVARDSSFSNIVINDSTVVDTMRQLPILSNQTKYYWRVRGKNGVGVGNYSTKWSFTTKRRRRDISETASITSLVTQPNGHGNPNVEVVRDSTRPPIGSTNALNQYDTYTGSARSFEWIGYTFTASHQFSNLEFQEGIEADSGGWFTQLNVQVRINGTWTDAQNLTTIPAYAPNNGVNFESYELIFDTMIGDGIRLAGTPGGTSTFISVAELRTLDDDTLSTYASENGEPDGFALSQNYPNPFNPTTQIAYYVPAKGYVTLKVFNVLGQEVATLIDGVKDAGAGSVSFAADHLGSGVYFYTLQSPGHSSSRKMILLR